MIVVLPQQTRGTLDGRLGKPFSLALGLEILIVLAGIAFLSKQDRPAPQPPRWQPLMLHLAPAPEPRHEQRTVTPPKPAHPAARRPVEPRHRVAERRPLAHRHIRKEAARQPRLRPEPQPTPQIPSAPMRTAATPVFEQPPTPAPAPRSPPAPPSSPAPRPSAPTPDELARFESAARAAIQSVLVYPPAARMMHIEGRVRVGFLLEHGNAHALHIVTPAAEDFLNQAALDAVRRARFPAPPRHLAAGPLRLSVWVEFRMRDGE